MKNILYITNTLEIGGTEVQLKNLLKYIDRSKFNPFVCVLKKSGVLEKEIRDLEVPIFILKKSSLNFTVLFDLLKIIKKHKIDIVHSALFASNFWGRIAGILTHKKIIASERSAYKKLLRIFLDRILAKFTDKIICNSEAVRKFQIQKEKIAPQKLEVIHNGIDLEEFDKKLTTEVKPEKENHFTIGNVCRITPEKNLTVWIETAKLLSDKNDNLRFRISGNASTKKQVSYKKKIIDLVEKNELQNKITIVDGQDVMKTFATIDLFFQSSDIEGFPTSLMEAMTVGLPTAATPAGGTKELIRNNENGIILNGKEEMATQILDLVKNPAKMQMLGRNARSTIENNFSAEKLARNTENVYKKLL